MMQDPGEIFTNSGLKEDKGDKSTGFMIPCRSSPDQLISVRRCEPGSTKSPFRPSSVKIGTHTLYLKKDMLVW